jgi:hypothetical protein
MINDPWNGKNPEDDPVFQSKIQAYRLDEYGPDALKAPDERGAIDRTIRIVPIQLCFDIEVTRELWPQEGQPRILSADDDHVNGPTAGKLYIDSDRVYDPIAIEHVRRMLEFKRRYRRTPSQ